MVSLCKFIYLKSPVVIHSNVCSFGSNIHCKHVFTVVILELYK